MSNVFPPPSQETFMIFISDNNRMEGYPLDIAEIQMTFKKQVQNPLAAGHISASVFALKLAQNPNFPARNPIEFENIQNSDTNLYWIKELHSKIMKPIALMQDPFSDFKTKFPNISFPLNECGQYRLTTRSITNGVTGQTKQLPRPAVLQKLMHLWFSKLAQFHLQNTSKIKHVSLQNINMFADKAHEAHLQLQCIHPFLDGTGRVARFVENVLRLRWGLPWTYFKPELKHQYITDIAKYENSPIWHSFLNEMDKL